jgi:hypothetical protein
MVSSQCLTETTTTINKSLLLVYFGHCVIKKRQIIKSIIFLKCVSTCGKTDGTKLPCRPDIERLGIHWQQCRRTEFVEKVERQGRPRGFLVLLVSHIDKVLFEPGVLVGADQGIVEDGDVLLFARSTLQQLFRRHLAKSLDAVCERTRAQIVWCASV